MRERLREPLGQPFVDAVLRPRLAADAAASLGAMVAVNQAHLVMLGARGLIAPGTAALVARALSDIAARGLAPDELDPALEDLYANLERAVARAAGDDAAGRMHVGRSRNDLGATVARMNARTAIDRVTAEVLDVRERLLDLAAAHADLVMPGYTHLQSAQPITAGFYLAGVADALARDTARLDDARRRLNRCPLGAGALAATSFPIDRETTARLLGFDGPLANALDAVASRDFVPESLAAFSLLALTLSRLAEDLYVWASVEIGLVEVSGAVAVASSIMPQKKNPAALEHVKGRTGHVIGALVAALASTKGTHFMHARDISVEVGMTFAQGEEALRVIVELTRAVLGAITFRRERGLELAARDFSTMTDLADALVRESDLPFRLAHEICATLVRDALDTGRGPADITATTVNAVASARAGRAIALAEATVRSALDPVASVARRTVPGGPAPAVVRAAVADARRALEHEHVALATRRAAVENALAELRRAADALARG
jgi:argininosuccinate lyase